MCKVNVKDVVTLNGDISQFDKLLEKREILECHVASFELLHLNETQIMHQAYQPGETKLASIDIDLSIKCEETSKLNNETSI